MTKKSNIAKRLFAIICATIMLFTASNTAFAIDNTETTIEKNVTSNSNSSIQPYGYVGNGTITVGGHQTQSLYIGDKTDAQFWSTILFRTSCSTDQGGVNISIYNGLNQFKTSFVMGSNDEYTKTIFLLGSGPYKFDITNYTSNASVTVTIGIY